MEINFQFNIGDLVTTKESASFNAQLTEKDKTKDAFLRRDHIPIGMTVLERLSQECTAGTQLLYLCSYYGPQGYCTFRFNEIELQKFEIEQK